MREHYHYQCGCWNCEHAVHFSNIGFIRCGLDSGLPPDVRHPDCPEYDDWKARAPQVQPQAICDSYVKVEGLGKDHSKKGW